MENENEILGFDPTQLSVNQPQEQSTSTGNPNIYKPRPADSKYDDGIYRAQIKVIYNPFNLKQSVIEQQSYAMQDENGFFQVVSSLTANDKNCPIFKAWKTCHFAKDNAILQKQAMSKDKGGKGLFDKRFARYVTIQVMEDASHPELVGKYMFWKMPKFIWDAIQAKQTPTSDKKAKIPVMDFLFGRAIDLEITPGPDDPKAPERKTREISYSTSEITEDIVSCTNPDGTPLLTAAEQVVLETYIDEMNKRVWKEKDAEARKAADAEIKANENTKELGKIYKRVMEQLKTFCPNLIDELGFKPWAPDVTERVNKWINVVLSGNDPAANATAPAVLTQDNTETVAKAAPTVAATPAPTPVTTSENDDLPF